mmetsp:Transcript_80002/g.192039  ORF Transcript_80002/g.192039 Transcript_80002/m.192039 type:complete len:157 (-) Transcript_80002:128-598(-)
MDLIYRVLLLSAACHTASAASEYNGSSYTQMTVTTERYACSGELTGGNSATKILQYVLGDKRCASQASYFECSTTGSKVGNFACDDASLIEEFSVDGCFACDDYRFSCERIWWKGTYYDAKYFKLYCNKPASHSGQSPIGRTWSVVLLLSSFVISW